MKPDVLELAQRYVSLERTLVSGEEVLALARAVITLSRSRSEGPIGYAVLHDHDGWLGCWRSLEVAEDVRSKDKAAVIYPVYAALSEPSAGMVMVPRKTLEGLMRLADFMPHEPPELGEDQLAWQQMDDALYEAKQLLAAAEGATTEGE